MKLKVYNDSFPLILIRGAAVRKIFDQTDLSMRQNSDREVLDKYHLNWIHNDIILVPSFHIHGENARVGMGRHRLTMLARHMEEIPAAFEREFCRSEQVEEILDRIVIRRMDRFEEFEYPDFPIEDLGVDVNDGLDWKRYV